MSITSLTFLIFIFITLFVYYIVPKRIQWVILLLSSLFFYYVCSNIGIIYVFITSLSIYIGCLLFENIDVSTKTYIKNNKSTLTKEAKKEYKAKAKKKKQLVLILALIINFSLLVIFKYSHFFITQINAVISIFNLKTINNTFSIIAPLGISYYTLQATGYLIDVFWGKTVREKNFFKTLLFVSFFPQITQGPINDFEELSKDLFSSHKLSYQNYSYGFQRLLWGFFKKMAIADFLSPYVTEGLSNYNNYSGTTCLICALLYMIQLYADFSGYMDIMCGYCQMLGIKLSENFNRPFFSKSVTEFWRRWHITLGAWLRKYVYYPVAFSKWNIKLSKHTKKRFGDFFSRQLLSTIALLFVWLFIGLWHDASWTYIMWGLGNAFFIITSLWFSPLYEKMKLKLKINEKSKGFKMFQISRTFVVLMLLEVIAAVSALSGNGFKYFAKVFTDVSLSLNIFNLLPNVSSGSNLTIINLFIAFAGVCLMFISSLLQRRRPIRYYFNKLPLFVRILIMSCAIILIASFGVEATWGAGAFMYANF